MKIKPRLKEELKKFLLEKEQEEERKAVISSAYRLSEKEIKEISALFPELKGKRIEQKLDESLIAGVVIRHGSKVRDLSLRHQLTNLEQRIHEIT